MVASQLWNFHLKEKHLAIILVVFRKGLKTELYTVSGFLVSLLKYKWHIDGVFNTFIV